jgi:hypothetical protein
VPAESGNIIEYEVPFPTDTLGKRGVVLAQIVEGFPIVPLGARAVEESVAEPPES